MMKGLRLNYPVPVMSRVLHVSESGYYAWVDRPLSSHDRDELRLELEIKAAHERTRRTYGPERLQHDLEEHGVRVGVCRIKRIRRKLGIRCRQKRKFKATGYDALRSQAAGGQESTESAVCSIRARQSMGQRHYVRADGRRVAVSGRA